MFSNNKIRQSTFFFNWKMRKFFNTAPPNKLVPFLLLLHHQISGPFPLLVLFKTRINFHITRTTTWRTIFKIKPSTSDNVCKIHLKIAPFFSEVFSCRRLHKFIHPFLLQCVSFHEESPIQSRLLDKQV